MFREKFPKSSFKQRIFQVKGEKLREGIGVPGKVPKIKF